MNWLEIIELRCTNRITEELKQSIDDLILEVKQEPDLPSINVYVSFAIDGNLSLHLVHEAVEPTENGSVLGLRIADALKAYGMVNHQIWRGLKKNNKGVKELI